MQILSAIVSQVCLHAIIFVLFMFLDLCKITKELLFDVISMLKFSFFGAC